MDFPANDSTTSSSPPRMPRRLRMRLSERKTSPSTVEEIEAKLRDADLRRQKFYQELSNKARQKPRSPSQSWLYNLYEEDLGQHLEANLQAAEQKRCWKQFVKLRRTTLDLAKAYDALNINEKYVKSMPFEQLALLVESTTTLLTLKALLDQIESRYKISRAVTANSSSSCWDDIDHLLKRVASPKKKGTARKFTQGREGKRPASTVDASKSPATLSRYQARIVLCAYMILGHPNAVLSGRGDREIALAKSAEKFVRELDLLVKIILDGPIQSSDEEFDDPSLARHFTFKSQIAAFDAAWCSYLNSFVVWKVKDAQILEEDLVRVACQLDLFMIQTCKLTPEEDRGALAHGTMAIQKQVLEDQKLLRERVHHLSGNAGIERMEYALSDTRKKYFQARNDGSTIGSPITHISSPDLPSSSDRHSSLASSDKRNDVIMSSERPSRVLRSLFKGPSEGSDSATPRSSLESQFNISGEKLATENELIVNEAVHEQRHMFADSFNVTEEDKNSTKGKIRETMEKAFWDGITESIKQEEPNYDRVVDLMREVRDEICEIAPQSWKQEIIDAIDLDILSEVLNSGKLDMDYLGRILEFALVTLLKLSAPANEDELKAAHQKLLKELAEMCETKDRSSNCSLITVLIKGLHFVLEHIQALKQEISKARIRSMEPLLKGPAGLDYLKRAFANRSGPPSDALTSLPLTMRWILSICDSKDQEWDEHANALLELIRRQKSSSQSLHPSTTLRTGGIISVNMSGSQMNLFAANPAGSDEQHSECKGEEVDLIVRLGLLKLVSGVSGLTQEALPETLKLNLSRLRAVQSQLQEIIVISTCVLVLRQTLLSEQMVANPADIEIIISSCVKQLSELLDAAEDAGIEEIVEVLGKFVGNKFIDNMKLQSMKNFMARMLTKSLQAGDAVFVRVSRAVYLAARGVVLGGSGAHGRELAEMALRQVGAVVLVDKVVEAASVVVVAATVSVSVHGPWYVHLIENM